jgi:hypothetical protein
MLHGDWWFGWVRGNRSACETPTDQKSKGQPGQKGISYRGVEPRPRAINSDEEWEARILADRRVRSLMFGLNNIKQVLAT